MVKSFESDNDPVWKCLDSKSTDLYNNKIEGVDQLSEEREVLIVSPQVF